MATTYEIHPLAEIFPEMTEAELNDLGKDILEQGQREPITLFEGKVLDGRNRYKACLLRDIEPSTTVFIGDDPVAFVVSKNLHRRQLNESQRALVATRLANLPHGGDRSKSPIGGLPQAEAAKLMNVSKRSVERAREVTKHGVPEVAKAVEKGEAKVSAAAEFAEQPKEEQARQIAKAGSVDAAMKTFTAKRKAEEKKAKEERRSPQPVNVKEYKAQQKAQRKAAKDVKSEDAIDEWTKLKRAAADFAEDTSIDIELAVSGASGSDVGVVKRQIKEAQAWLSDVLKALATKEDKAEAKAKAS